MVLDCQTAAVARLDDHWTITAVSPALCRLLSVSAEQLCGRSFPDFVAADCDLPAWLGALPAGHAPGPVRRDLTMTGSDGRRFRARAVILPRTALPSHAAPSEISLTELDALHPDPSDLDSEIQLLDRWLSVFDDVFWIDRYSDHRTVYLNAAFTKVWGLPIDHLLDQDISWVSLIHPDDRSRVGEEFQRCFAAGISFTSEYRIVRADGALRWVWDKTYPVRDATGAITSYIGSAKDITERKLEEIEMARRQAAQNIGSIGADLAHNFNNLLAIVDLSAHALVRTGKLEASNEKLAAIRSAVARGAEITNSLLAMSSRQMLDPVQVDANAAIEELQPLIAASTGPNIRVTCDLTTLKCPLRIDKAGLNQAIVNLVTNAREAMPAGGEIRLVTRRRDSSLLPRPGGDQACQVVAITIEDSGTGMDEHMLRHATDPYFTTKGDGTGFGLAITNAFVLQSGGRLKLENRAGGGLSASLILPLAAAGDEPGAAPTGLPAPRRETILVIDDEAPLTVLVSDLLASADYDVTCATTVEQARQCLDQSDFSLVICDIALGVRQTGVDVANWVAERNRATKVLLMSGYPTDKVVIPSGLPFIKKPFAPEALIDLVDQLLGQGDRGK